MGAGRLRGFQPMVVRVTASEEGARLLRWMREKRFTFVAIPQPPGAAPIPTTPQPWLDVLVRHGLLDAASEVRPDHYGCDPVGVLLSVRAARAAIPRGLVHYDVGWEDDTDNLVSDLATIAGCPDRFSLLGLDRQELRFEFRHPDGRIIEEAVDVDDGDLDRVAARMDVRLAEMNAERRIWTLETGIDRWAFLGRAPEDISAMREQGLPLDGLRLAAEPAVSAGEVDWSDVGV